MFERIKNKVLSKSQLKDFRQENTRKKIVFCTGCYDIIQTGHAVFFNQCKEFGDILVVGVGSDEVIRQLKGPGRPVNPEINRLYLIAAMHDVDFAVLNQPYFEEGKIDFREIIEDLKPDVFVLNDDDSAISFKKAICDNLNIRIELVSRVVPPELEATSTTRIIEKINFKYRAPLRIDFAGGWTDVPFIMKGKLGYVSNVAIKPLIEYSNGQFNFSGYPRGSGISTSTAAQLLTMISAKNYNVESRSLSQIAEDLFNLENKELNWAIGRQDQYSIVFGGFNCMEYADNYAKPIGIDINKEILDELEKHLLLLHTGVSRNAQSAVEEVYKNHDTKEGQDALEELTQCGLEFAKKLSQHDLKGCAEIMSRNYIAQKKLAASTSNESLEKIYQFALSNGAWGGKICGAGGGGAFVFLCENPDSLKTKLKETFVDCFEIDFAFEYQDIRKLNII